MSEEQATPVFQIQRVYLKDLSLEQPNSPAILTSGEQPSVAIPLGVGLEQVADGDSFKLHNATSGVGHRESNENLLVGNGWRRRSRLDELF